MSRPELSISLRICGDELAPEDITDALQAEPTEARRKGAEVRKEHFVGRAPTGVWIRRVQRPDGDINERISVLLGSVTADPTVWQRLRARYRLEIFCGVFLRSSNQGLSVSPQILGELANRGLQLSLDMYTDGNE